jgi:hypothetical protein
VAEPDLRATCRIATAPGRRARLARGVALAVLIACGIVALPLAARAGLGIVELVIVAALLGIAAHFSRERLRPGAIEIADSVLRVTVGGTSREVPRSHIAQGFTVPAQNGAALELSDGGRIVLAGLSPPATPDRVLELLGVGPETRALSVPLRELIGPFVRGLLAWAATCAFVGGLLASVVGPIGLVAGMIFASALTYVLQRGYGRPRLVVGADGIRVERFMNRTFVAYDRIERVETLWLGGAGASSGHPQPYLRVHLKPDRGWALPALVLPFVGQSQAMVDAFAERVRRGIASYGRDAGARVDALSRGGRSLRDWRADVARLTTGGFRDAALQPSDLERVLLDGSAPGEQRIGAALALRTTDPELAAQRIRVAAETCADARLRVALEATLEDGEPADDAILGALPPRDRS